MVTSLRPLRMIMRMEEEARHLTVPLHMGKTGTVGTRCNMSTRIASRIAGVDQGSVWDRRGTKWDRSMAEAVS